MPQGIQGIGSLRGGLNEQAPATIADDQCAIAENIEWISSPVGERRLGHTAIDLTGSPLAGASAVVWLYRHTPSADTRDTQLWAFGWTAAVVPILAYKDATWHAVAMPDPIVMDGVSEYQIDGQSLHGKLFLAYRSAVDRLHVWDGTTLRRTGLAGVGVQASVVTTGSGTFAGYRYYRVRYKRGPVRSEPTPAVGFGPPGNGSGAIITRPAGPGEGETEWECEASLDNANWYRIATLPIATTTHTDTTAYDVGYAVNYPLSEDIGDYSLIPSVKLLSADEDRLFCGSSFVDPALASRVMWTPPYAATGLGNDERLALDTNPYLDLDNYDGGALTNLSGTVNGYLYATKWRHTYQIARTGVRTRSYEAIPLTKQRGALPRSLVDGFDQGGKPFCFALDPDVGPVQIGGAGGIEPCGGDLVKTWPTVNLDAVLPCVSFYYPAKRQIHWFVATKPSDSPKVRIVLHTNLLRHDPEGTRGGFALWTGGFQQAYAACMYAENVNVAGPRSRSLKPLLGFPFPPMILQGDVGNYDTPGGGYAAILKSKAFVRSGLLDQFEVGEAQVMTTATPGAKLDVALLGMRSDKTRVRKVISGIDLTPTTDEGEHVIHSLDNLGLAELQTLQIQIADAAVNPTPGAWQLELVSMTLTGGQKSRGG